MEDKDLISQLSDEQIVMTFDVEGTQYLAYVRPEDVENDEADIYFARIIELDEDKNLLANVRESDLEKVNIIFERLYAEMNEEPETSSGEEYNYE